MNEQDLNFVLFALRQAREWIIEAKAEGVKIPCAATLTSINEAISKINEDNR